MRGLTRIGIAGLVTCVLSPTEGGAQITASTDRWCADATTLCWADPDESVFLSGLRFIFEPQLGVLIQDGDNKFDDTSFGSLEKIGLATNLYGRQLGVQVLFIYPSTVHFDDQSPVRVNNLLLDVEDGKVDVEWGMTAGLTALDGVLSLGVGFLHYDKRDFAAESAFPTPKEFDNAVGDGFFYLNIQAIEAVKGVIKAMRDTEAN